MSFDLENLTKSLGLNIPLIILNYFEKAYNKYEIIQILSETVGYHILSHNILAINYINVNKQYHNYDDIQVIRNEFYKKYMELLSKKINNKKVNFNRQDQINTCINEHDNLIVQDTKLTDTKLTDTTEHVDTTEYIDTIKLEIEEKLERQFILNLSTKWFYAYVYSCPKKELNQQIIHDAFEKNMLKYLDPRYALMLKLDIAWDVVKSNELWKENIDKNYWTKLYNLVQSK